MTRINVVPPSELSNKHLVAEHHEITRVFALARAAQYQMHKKKQPAEYTLGTGHVVFLYDKLQFVTDRYSAICDEMRSRNFTCNQIPKEDLHAGIEKHMFWNYKPTEKAIAINRQRILERS